MTCSYETERIAEDRDRLAHNPEVMACAAPLGCTRRSTLLLEPIHVLGVLRARSACGRPSLFSPNVALVVAESCCCGG
jgi:hypothetical protein